MDVRVENPEEMKREAAQFAARIVPQQGAATILALSGDLGAGKTTFVQGVGNALGVEEPIVSPTFVLMRAYPLGGAFDRLIHIDAYRIEDSRELSTLRWSELTADPRNLIALEWPERIAALTPEAHRIRFSIDEPARIISYES